MDSRRFDVLVVGAGPAGSIAALVLARAGAHVALLDKAPSPRDKACGDFVGPRGLQVLSDLGVAEPPGLDVGDMVVVGPTGRRVVLPSFGGLSYPGRARAVPRTLLDSYLRAAAVDAGAVPCAGRADRPLWSGPALDGFALDGAGELRADFVIGADGATSHVAASAGLVEGGRVLWGFAVRSYLDQHVELPAITLWEQTRWRAFPGYGWIFPGPGGVANVGVGIGTLADRQSGAGAVRALPAYLDHLVDLGLLDRVPAGRLPPRLGGWLKMGMVGTTRRRGVCSWSATPPALSIHSRVKASPRQCPAAGRRPNRFSPRPAGPRPPTGTNWPGPISRISGSPPPAMRPWSVGPPPSPPSDGCSPPRPSDGPWPAVGESSGTNCSTALRPGGPEPSPRPRR